MLPVSFLAVAMTGFPLQSGLVRCFSFSYYISCCVKNDVILFKKRLLETIQEKISNKINNNFADFEKINTFAPQNEM